MTVSSLRAKRSNLTAYDMSKKHKTKRLPRLHSFARNDGVDSSLRGPRLSRGTRQSPRNLNKFSILLAIFVLLILFCLPGQNIYQTTWQISKPAVAGVSVTLPSPAPYPVNLTGVQLPNISSQSVVIIDLTSSVILYQKNPQQKLLPASTTKLMTALVGLEIYKLDQLLEVKTVITEGKVMGVTQGEKFTFENLLYAALVDSANDAAYTIAENYPGGVENFIKGMNQKALELHMENTHFKNPMGFEDIDHYSTALDLAHLASFALKKPEIAQVVGISNITIPNSDFSKFYSLSNVNSLLGKIPGVMGIKTGWTETAGECLIAAVERDGHKVLFVILDSQDRFGETEKLIDWVFTNFNWQALVPPKRNQ